MAVREIRVFAPASVANVAVGFDALGFAIDLPGDEIVARRVSEPGLRIGCITGTGDKSLPTDIERNTAGVAAAALLASQPELDFGIELDIHKRMPFGSGLGSSAASAAGAVVAVNALLPQPLARQDLLRFAVLGEQAADGAFHADNVGPSLLGGILLIRDNPTLDVHSVPCPTELCAAVIHPKVEILTKEARTILQPAISLQLAIEQAANMGGLVLGLCNGDYELIGRSLQDRMIEPQRAKLIPHFYEVREAALSKGALGCSISGAGPSIFALTRGMETARAIGETMQRVFQSHAIDSSVYVSGINHRGVELLQSS